MNQIGSDPYDFSVCDIDFIVLREPDTGWKLEQMINRGHYILAFALGGHVTYEYGGGKIRTFIPISIMINIPCK